VRFIDEHAAHTSMGRCWGVESICTVLAELGAPIAPSTYYDARRAAKQSSPACQRDVVLASEVARVHAENYGVYGARKVWAQLNREGVAVARCTVERLMRAQGLAGARRGRRVRTTIPGESRRILGWRAATTMRTSLVLDALEQAVWSRAQHGARDLSGLVMHSDAHQRGQQAQRPAGSPRASPIRPHHAPARSRDTGTPTRATRPSTPSRELTFSIRYRVRSPHRPAPGGCIAGQGPPTRAQDGRIIRLGHRAPVRTRHEGVRACDRASGADQSDERSRTTSSRRPTLDVLRRHPQLSRAQRRRCR
jgi:HTH-like domain